MMTKEKSDNERRGNFIHKERPPKEDDKQEKTFMSGVLKDLLK